MKKVLILGAGMVGTAIAADLCTRFFVTSADIDSSALNELQRKYPSVATERMDVANADQLITFSKPFDLVISAVPGFMGYKTLEALILAGKNVVDISFFPEDSLTLDALAKAKDVSIIVDCGVAPGIPNLVAGYHAANSEVIRFEYMVGGLPFVRTKPFEYKAPFSPCDVIEEYTRPARLKENGKIITKPALSDAELIHFDGIGTLEAFNSDGLRSLLYTLPGIPDMKEKTLRYPGHIGLIASLRDSGFFNTEPMLGKDGSFVPFEITSEILKKAWKLQPDEREFTVMRIRVEMEEKGHRRETTYALYDEFDATTGLSSMARTTGFTCTAAASLLLEKGIGAKGILPPELLATEPEAFRYIFDYLADRQIHIDYSEKDLF